MKKKIAQFLVLFAALILVLAGCTTESSQKDSDKLQVVTTFYPMYDFTQNVAGDQGEVTLLMPAGTEPHDYEPSAKDIAKIVEADIFIYSSDDMESWVASVLPNIDTDKTVVIEAAKDLAFLEGEDEHDHDHGEEESGHAEEDGHDHSHEVDPHVWLDPVLAQEQVAHIRDGLITADEANKASYEANAAAYISKLKDLDELFETTLKDATNRSFVTQHSAFSYLAHRYDLEQVAVSGISPDQEPSAAKLAEISKFIKENDVNVIYFESAASPKIAEALSKETGAELAVLSPIEGITQEDQEQGIDYIKLMEQNLEALQKSIK